LYLLAPVAGTADVTGNLRVKLEVMAEMGRFLVFLGVALVMIGGVVMLLGRSGLPVGRLPGDFLYRGKHTTFYFPLATSILVSVVLSLLFFLVGRLKR
jgi:Protein of unknown function (DUF2905)